LTETHPDILAPIAEGDVLGTLKVRLGGRELASRPLVALAAVPPGSLFRRFMDEIFLILE
jgi:D-alanyl-D-alanine carboxypeptidase (penicillin-binding protein 5/6)